MGKRLTETWVSESVEMEWVGIFCPAEVFPALLVSIIVVAIPAFFLG